MLKLWTVFLVGTYFFFSSVVLVQQPQEDDSKIKSESASLLMEAKLSNSQQLLRGLVTEDYDSIAKAATKMKKIAEAAHWPSSVDEVYQHYSYEFRRQCDKLITNAEKKDLQASNFTFLQIATACVDCHEYVRPRFKIQREPRGPIRLIPTDWNRDRYPVRPSPDDADTDTTTERRLKPGSVFR